MSEKLPARVFLVLRGGDQNQEYLEGRGHFDIDDGVANGSDQSGEFREDRGRPGTRGNQDEVAFVLSKMQRVS